ncbi:IS256 family transposase [Sediminimonas qiaohouensis]|uniref:IS256 family transposase n=1 Tax=Sediminimonas qiaohouensis TaxID=552061 RepID=UPI00042A6C83|nr:IS256 family transposase [Sediminimonas qiaohouensis]
MAESTKTDRAAPLIGGDWTDPLEDGVRSRVRDFIETILEEELEAALGRGRYERKSEGATGYRNGHRDREIVGTFGPETIRVPRARIAGADGKTTEWRSQALPRYRRLTRKAEALIAGAYLAGTNTRRVKRALSTLFAGAVGKDVVSRAWRKVKTDWEAWAARNLSGEDIVRLILDGTVVKAHIDKRATAIPILVAVGVRRDGQKVLIGLKNMGGETTAAWRAFLENLSARGLREPGFVIVDGAPGLEAALAGLWPDAPVQRCTVHKHRNLLAHAPKRLHDELTEDYRDMIYAETAVEIERRRKAFLRNWRLKCRAVADSLEEAGERLFTFTRLPPGQWKSARTTNAIERLHAEFKRRIKTQTVLPQAATAPMLFWALLASGQIVMRKVDGWETLDQPLANQPIDLAA